MKLRYFRIDCNAVQCSVRIKIRDELPAKPSGRDVERNRNTLENCVILCADKNVELVPALTKTLLETLKNRNFEFI
ncbi:protein FAM136A, partial [Biomphalaria glabrata]